VLNKPYILRIKKDNVDFYNAEKHKLPCWNCLVKTTCFNEKKATKRAKYLRYTLNFNTPCMESILAIKYLIYANSDLIIPLDQIKRMPISDLFDTAINYILSSAGKNKVTGFVMMICVVHRDANYISYDNQTAYQSLGHLFHYTLNEIDIAIELFSKSVELTTKDTSIFEDRGFSYLKKNDFIRALNDFNEAIKNNGGCHPDLEYIIEDVKDRQNKLRGNEMYDVYYENK